MDMRLEASSLKGPQLVAPQAWEPESQKPSMRAARLAVVQAQATELVLVLQEPAELALVVGRNL
eukprot:CAMPEP_0172728142 /NCGR_PEP_ID=MMETSP1074-20121228/92073_1 /TAXON_ID=2916 /ORGANISM="Ceratium fusus, Strain PA161109" /LENGTH=63 /DNA_ID=CAMNT_0013555361 /DNA_START=234 /DNA_END=425 /DNA_ORIENTATION=-